MIIWFVLHEKEDIDFISDVDFTLKDWIEIIIPLIIWNVFLVFMHLWAFGRLV